MLFTVTTAPFPSRVASAAGRLCSNGVRGSFGANRCGTWTINAQTGKVTPCVGTMRFPHSN